jgi:hypothetical protein
MLDFHARYLLGTEISWYCTFFAIEAISQLTEKNQLQYLLVAPMAVHRTSRVDKTAALTGLPLDRIIGSYLAPTLRTKQRVWIGRSTALVTLTCLKFDATSFAKTRTSIV